MHTREALGQFLRARRSGLDPSAAGVVATGTRRRVAGLRREELAGLADISTSYYARLEQGHSRHASDQVLDSLARALRLTVDERRHLRALAEQQGTAPALEAPPDEQLSPAMGDLMAALAHKPAVVLGRRGDVLAWTESWHALLAPHLDLEAPTRPGRPNTAAMVFLDSAVRDLYVDWETKAASVVEQLRLVSGRHPKDTALVGLVDRLSAGSADFARLWSRQGVRRCPDTTYAVQHPVRGRLTVRQQTLVPADDEQQLVVATVLTEAASALRTGASAR